MATYQCVDGPLAGQTVSRRRRLPTGRPVTVAEVDVEHGVLAVDYVQDREPAGARGPAPTTGRLRFVAARDVRRRRSGLRVLSAR